MDIETALIRAKNGDVDHKVLDTLVMCIEALIDYTYGIRGAFLQVGSDRALQIRYKGRLINIPTPEPPESNIIKFVKND